MPPRRKPSSRPRSRSKREATPAAAAKAPATKTIDDAAKPGAPPQELKDLGPPPDDPLAAQAYLYRMLVLSAYDVARDEKISPRERRKELRTITASSAKLMPRSRLYQAEQVVLADRAELVQKARDRGGAKLEKRPPRPPPVEHVEEPKP